MDRTFFKKEISDLNEQIALVQKIDKINSRLQKFNWIFLHPQSHGIDITMLAEYIEQKDGEEKILKFFAFRFLSLRTTISFIEGYYKKRPFLRDYGTSIEESVILCLQKDFKAAIFVLLPVIEGTLRKYLIHKKGEEKRHEVDMKKLISNSFSGFEEDYMGLQKKYLQGCSKYHELDQSQEKEILKKRAIYFSLWLKQPRSFFENNLYFNTRSGKPTDKLNRHLMFHALDDDIEFSFANYLRLYNCVSYLSWIIGMTNEGDGCSVFSEPDSRIVANKWIDCLKILSLSESLGEAKSGIFGNKPISFKEFLPKAYLEFIEPTGREIKRIINDYELLKKNTAFRTEGVSGFYRSQRFFKRVRKLNEYKGDL